MTDNHLAHDLLSLMVNLAQINDVELIRSVFLDALNNVVPGMSFGFFSETDPHQENLIRITTTENAYGFIGVQNTQEISAEIISIVDNAIQMLAIILENQEQSQLLSAEKESLAAAVAVRTAELQDHRTRLEFAIVGSKGGEWFYEYDPDDASGEFTPIAVFYSPQLKQFIGYRDDEFPNSLEAWDQQIFPEDLLFIQQKVRAVLTGRQEFLDEEFQIYHKDGSVRWLATQGRVQRAENGNPIRFSGIDWDITDQKQAELELQLQTAQLKALRAVGLEIASQLDLEALLNSIVKQAVDLLGGIGGGIALLRQKENVLDYSVYSGIETVPGNTTLQYGEGFCGQIWKTQQPLIINNYAEWAGRALVWEGHLNHYANVGVPVIWRGDFLGVLDVFAKPPRKFVNTDADLLSLFANQAAIAIYNVQQYEQIQQYAFEMEQLVRERTAELEDRITQSEKLNRGMINLMSDLQKANHRANTAAQQLVQANQELEAFAYSVSHDLRAPLRGIGGFAQILAERHKADLNPQGQEYIDYVVQASGQMENLIADLLTYSRLGRRGIQLRPVDCAPLLAETLFIFKDQIEKCQAEVKIPDEFPTVLGDHTTLLQIFTNLLDNALKYRHPGIPSKIKISVESTAEDVVFTVEDNGIGIPVEHHEVIFNVFQRLHSGNAVEGTGIGLALVKKAVILLNGEITVDSNVGKGAKFTVRLPLATGE
jgi:PAS domain S-box-containing protein